MGYIDFEYGYNCDMEDDYDQEVAYERELEMNEIFEESFDLVMCFVGIIPPTNQKKLRSAYNLTELHELFGRSKNYPTSGSKSPRTTFAFKTKAIQQIKQRATSIVNCPSETEYSMERIQQWSSVLTFVFEWEEFMKEHPDGHICVYWYKEKR